MLVEMFLVQARTVFATLMHVDVRTRMVSELTYLSFTHLPYCRPSPPDSRSASSSPAHATLTSRPGEQVTLMTTYHYLIAIGSRMVLTHAVHSVAAPSGRQLQQSASQ